MSHHYVRNLNKANLNKGYPLFNYVSREDLKKGNQPEKAIEIKAFQYSLFKAPCKHQYANM